MTPPNIYAVTLAAEGEGIHTFSNGTAWEMWAHGNCFSCRYFDAEGACGEYCALEGAAILGLVTPELAKLFGWTQTTTQYGPRYGWEPPQTCRFWRDKTDDDGNPADPRVPDLCPETLSLFADQRTTADIAAPVGKQTVRRSRKVVP